MAVNQTKIFDTLEEIVFSLNREEFIYNFLSAYNLPKATITQLRQGGSRNIAKESSHIGLKNKVYFEPAHSDDGLDKKLFLRLTDPLITKNKIRFVIITDFLRFLAWDTQTGERLDIDIDELHSYYAFFLPLVGLEKALTSSENPADVKAAEKMGKLFDLIKINNNLTNIEDIHILNVFLTRILFCFFAEDTGIFSDTQFTSAIKSYTEEDGSDLDSFLYQIFSVLNTPEDSDKRKNLPKHISDFRYVNGGLFSSDEPIPELGKKGRRILLDCGSMDWSEINPDIFGSMFQAIIDVEQRSRLGQHYTSYSNIMKVIQPLFIEPLRSDFEKNRKSASGLKKLLIRMGEIKIFDPACGSGNFLIVAYKELRKLEMEIIMALREIDLQFTIPMSELHLSQFYGIEIDDFACEVARLSLWLAEHQLNNQWKKEFNNAPPTLPLRESGHIVHGNSLREDWSEICPKSAEDEVYVIGNPPFLGTLGRSDEQRKDMQTVFSGFNSLGSLDFVACWFWKGAQYIKESRAELSLVATNSICQGEQVATLWPAIFKLGLNIHFAYPTFTWVNNARDKAAVHVIIVGLSSKEASRRLYQKVGKEWHNKSVKNISPYLIEGSNVCVSAVKSPLSPWMSPLVRGNGPTDNGNLLLDTDEKAHLISKEPSSEKWIKKIIGADEFLNGNDRYCLWLVGITDDELKKLPMVTTRVNAVREFRMKSTKEATRRKADTPHLFDEIRQPLNGDYILIPRVSSERRVYIPIGFFNSSIIASDRNFILPNGTLFDFGLITSLMHNEWMRLTAMRLKSDYSYGNKIVYNTFPWPDVNDEKRAMIEKLAEEVLLTRAEFPGKTLAELYDPEKMPESLLQTHQTLDKAVDRLYREKPFKDADERLSFLLARYETLVSQ
ncbi:class I SAM-dependent DNA methyltransferase [Xenorhabdus miraniensis]|uniref:site-specific DNA-methyltransferase (adenine-specific) n=1 Tax=Xenorhabdus miraniensis TaxID=351674 RepID=A0A2D0JJB1_9GAMM|nr:DNA methyltransferase [Xenorhabdus miraniensis]PHM45532.1 type II restriction enzyme [Xenorhabdus miraniensis]